MAPRPQRLARFFALAALAAPIACGGSLPRPRLAPQPANAYVEVPGPPPPPRAEIVPPRPPGAVWIDGAWIWEGTRWRWDDGGWFTAPAGARYALWSTVRRDDGVLLYAKPQWLDARGAPLPDPPRVVPSPAIGGKPPESP